MNILAVQGTLKSLLHHHSSNASVLRHSAFFMVQLSHPYMTTGKSIPLTRRAFVGKVMSLLFNMLSRFVIDFLLIILEFDKSSELLLWKKALYFAFNIRRYTYPLKFQIVLPTLVGLLWWLSGEESAC